ncbi:MULTISPECIES: type II secretion system protein J [unclassified Butyricimonas]|uniref:PulJ/GspJ family protein n=1 Tax=unclassified Butyricimonas TaxID=2637652 RepID=UPI00208AF0AB|nr:type II secretion system protein [uncultured Butyricimonas sp.]BDF54523.1 hypothetical protein CE91St21_19580 [Odoribacteraceae bacterium]GKH93385.1 hypothetical protein CE91St23_18810 [Odoribacteraceae bacterium]GKH99723.1 hypothetical protein CE91St22_36010 [Odoribacteraceae bacterium]GKI04244.1 hypothetical protein CE91St24_35190 [Odoribacteraceae bacterium]
MKRRFSYTFAASTLVEMLIVIIVSGILFIALFDGVDLVRRYTNRLNKALAAGNSLLDSYQQLDHLFLSCDSVTASTGIFCFYKGGERLALVEHRDSLLVCTRSIGVDTLFRGVEEIRVVPVWDVYALVDSLGVRFRTRGKSCYFEFGRARSPEDERRHEVLEIENQFKKEEYDDME